MKTFGDGTTRLSVTWQPINANEVEEATFDGARAGMQGGWDHQFGQIEAYLAEPLTPANAMAGQ